MKRPNVTILGSLPPIIGSSLYTKGLVQELIKEMKVYFLGFNHIYPSHFFPGEIYDNSLSPLAENANLEIRNVLNWYNPFGWIIEAFRIKTEVIHAQWWSFPLAPIYVTILGINRLRKRKIILTVHNVMPHEKSFLRIFFNKSVFFFADEYIVHTQQNKDALQKIVGAKKIHILPHGSNKIPLKGFTKEEARVNLKINPDDKILLCFGNIRDYKGLDVAIKAVASLQHENIKLLVAGKCWEDWGKYEDLINKYNVQNRVIRHLGFIPAEAIELFFKAADLVLLPYKYFDAQSGIGAIGLAFGIPMVVSDTGGLAEYVNNPYCVVAPNDPEALAQKVIRILEDKNLYKELARDIQIKAEQVSWENVAKMTIDVYAGV